MRTCKMFLTTLALGVMAGSADAAITITDVRNFEGGVDGTAFNTGVFNISSNQLTEADGSAQSPYSLNGVTPTSETKGVVLTNSSTTGTARFGADITNYVNTNTYYVQFDLKATTLPNNVMIEFRSGNNNTGTQGILTGLMQATGNVTNREGAGGANTFVDAFGSPVSLSLSTWYRYTLTINPTNGAADTYDLRVQSIETNAFDQTATGLDFRNNLSDINSYNIFNNATASKTGDVVAIDNLKFTNNVNDLVFDVIPEPSSLALLGIGGLFVARRRRV